MHMIKWLPEKTSNNSNWQRCGEKETLCTAGENANWLEIVGKCMKVP